MSGFAVTVMGYADPSDLVARMGGIGGKALCEAICHALQARGYVPQTEVGADDWGWSCFLRTDVATFLCGAASDGDPVAGAPPGTWPAVALLDLERHFGRPDGGAGPDPAARAEDDLRAVLDALPGLSAIQRLPRP